MVISIKFTFFPFFMKHGENYCRISLLFSLSFMRIGQKMQIIYQWPIVELRFCFWLRLYLIKLFQTYQDWLIFVQNSSNLSKLFHTFSEPCPSGTFYKQGICCDDINEVNLNGVCCIPGFVVQDGVCKCPAGQAVQNGACTTGKSYEFDYSNDFNHKEKIIDHFLG